MKKCIYLMLLICSLFLLSARSEPLPTANNASLNYRQIHMDFHNWRHFPDFLEKFDADAFAQTLADAHVNSVTVFGRCAQGWMYYPSKQFPEHVHPDLDRNLLAEQIDACHERNIKAPIYVIVQCDPVLAEKHPEWRVITKEGKQLMWGGGTGPYDDSFWHMLCVNTPYQDFLKAHVKEMLDTVPVDGFFFDIVIPLDCSCTWCQAGMKEQGIDPRDDAARQAYGKEMLHNWIADMSRFIRKYDKDCSIFYNSGHVGPRHRKIIDSYTHLELESLPSGGWGYMHFPMTIRYARLLGKECMGMTGKFHTTWGDFHSFKNQAALEYEVFNMLALNAKCSIGDQLHPNGKLNMAAYERIGAVYASVEEKEPWCEDATAVTDVAILHPDEFRLKSTRHLSTGSMGATRMLQELRQQFDFIDSQMDFSQYKVLILPDHYTVPVDLAAKLNDYVANGGSLIASFEAGLDPSGKDFLESLGIEKIGHVLLDEEGNRVRGRFYPKNNYAEYIVPTGDIGQGLPETEHVMYAKGMDVSAEDADILLNKTLSYFDRTWEHYASHRQTPSSGKTGNPAVVKNGRAIYFAHPIFSQYQKNTSIWCRTLFANALDMLLPEPVLRVDGPSTLQATLNQQTSKNRYVLHVLHYIPERRGQDFDVIEDVIPLYNVPVSLNIEQPVKSITLVPAGTTLEFEQKDRIEFTVPEVSGHQMVEIAYD